MSIFDLHNRAVDAALQAREAILTLQPDVLAQAVGQDVEVVAGYDHSIGFRGTIRRINQSNDGPTLSIDRRLDSAWPWSSCTRVLASNVKFIPPLP